MTLFLRSRRGMTLTTEGEALLHFCRGASDLEGLFLSKVGGRTRQEVSLTILGPTSAISGRIPRDVVPLYAKYPFLRLHLQSEDELDLIGLIRKGKADLAILPPNLVPDEMESKRLQADRYLLVGARKLKNRKLSEIVQTERIIDFYSSDLTTEKYLSKFGLKGRKDRLFVNENAALIHLIIAGVGIGTLGEEIAEPFFRSGELIPLNQSKCMEEPLALVWYTRPQRTPYFEDLIRSVK